MCPIAGGNWNNGVNAGVWTLNLNNVRGNSNDNIGFRADSVTPHTLHGARPSDGGTKGDAFRREATSRLVASAKSVGLRISGSDSPRSTLSGCERQVQESLG